MDRAASWYGRRVRPYLIDFGWGMKPLRQQRGKVVPLAVGRALEIGIGTGLNLSSKWRPCAVLFLLAAGLSLALAQPLRPLPPLLQSVSDEVGALSRQEGRQLADQIEDMRRATGARIVIVVAETTGEEDIERYVDRLAQRWRVERHLPLERSVFIVIAVKDRALHISAGNDLGAVQRAIRGGSLAARVQPLLREEQYYAALAHITMRVRNLIIEARKSAAVPAQPDTAPSSPARRRPGVAS